LVLDSKPVHVFIPQVDHPPTDEQAIGQALDATTQDHIDPGHLTGLVHADGPEAMDAV